NPPFGVRVQVRTARREWNSFYTTSRERRLKHRAELRVAIVQSVPRLLQKSPVLAGRVARHLLHPCLVGMPGNSGQADAATLQVDEEQDVTRSSDGIWSIELVGNQLAIPSQNGIGFGHGGDLGQSLAPESLFSLIWTGHDTSLFSLLRVF